MLPITISFSQGVQQHRSPWVMSAAAQPEITQDLDSTLLLIDIGSRLRPSAQNQWQHFTRTVHVDDLRFSLGAVRLTGWFAPATLLAERCLHLLLTADVEFKSRSELDLRLLLGTRGSTHSMSALTRLQDDAYAQSAR